MSNSPDLTQSDPAEDAAVFSLSRGKLSPDLGPTADVCIVGAGPVGIAVAVACAEQGLKVLLVESGGQHDSDVTAELSQARLTDPARHAPMAVAVRRGLGGTSAWWGGRCVPFDPVDFEHRPWLKNSDWPIGYADVEPWQAGATDFMGCSPASYEAKTDPLPLGDAQFTHLERWTPVRHMFRVHRERLEKLDVRVMTNTTVTDILFNDADDEVMALVAQGPGGERMLRAAHYVIACGGLETTRLLLVAQHKQPLLFGGRDGPLGRFYAGHMSGKIADLVFKDPKDARHADFFLDNGVFARRRFTLPAQVQARERLLNGAFWIDNPPFHDPSHHNGALSLIWMALAIPQIGRLVLSDGVRLSHIGPKPYPWKSHFRNVISAPIRMISEVLSILRKRILGRPPQPGFLLRSASGRYALHYHCEQSAHADSRVHLSAERDALGMPRLHVDIRFCHEDAERIVRAHKILDGALRDAGVGQLIYKNVETERTDSVLAQATDGFHQTGLTRMSDDPTKGVVDADCTVHGISNLHVASSSVFPSSSQANPTLLAVALGLRLAARLATLDKAGKD